MIEVLKNSRYAQKIASLVENENFAITTISVHELLAGASQKDEFLIKNIIPNIEILPFAEENAIQSSNIARNLAKQGKLINELDMLIAGICLTHDAVLITLDNDFKRILNLKLLEI